MLQYLDLNKLEDDLLDQIFNFMVRDFSKFALQLYSKPSSNEVQMDLCMKMIKKTANDKERFNRIWKNYVYKLNGAYEMNK